MISIFDAARDGKSVVAIDRRNAVADTRRKFSGNIIIGTVVMKYISEGKEIR